MIINTVWKVSKNGVFCRVYFTAFSPNPWKFRQKKLGISTLFTQCNVHKTGASLNDFCQLYNLKHLENYLLVTKLVEAVNIDDPKY